MLLRNNCDILDYLWPLENINKSPYLNSVQSGPLKTEFQRWHACRNQTQSLETFQIFKRVGDFRNCFSYGEFFSFFFFCPCSLWVKNAHIWIFYLRKGSSACSPMICLLRVCSHYSIPEMNFLHSRKLTHRQDPAHPIMAMLCYVALVMSDSLWP